MKIFLTLNYWFNLRPEPLTSLAEKIFDSTIIVLLLITIILALTKRRGGLYRGTLNSFYNFSLANTLIGLFIFFSNYELIPFFAARFWFAIWALIMLIWLIFIFKKLKTIPRAKQQIEKEKELKKYLP